MSYYRCLGCRGVYEDPQPDGSLYFHVCPPASIDFRGRLQHRPEHRDENLVFDEAGHNRGPKRDRVGRHQLAGTELDAHLAVLDRPPAPRPQTLAARIKERMFGRKAEKEA